MQVDGKSKKRILLIEPSLMVGKGFASVIEDVIGYQLIASAQNASRLSEQLLSSRPDIIVFNPLIMSFQHRTSIRSFFNIPAEIALVALVYTFVDEWILSQFDAILTVNDDQTQMVNKLNGIKKSLPVSDKSKSENEELSERENEILECVVKGMTNKEIAEKHFISIHTVITHRKNIVRKTGIKSVSGLTVYALLNSLITYEDIE
ncbi:MAG: DNA-binding response regulator [Bacteroidetes bacterium]|jgi:DNA-binding NarL/FixJ family response regulator|nr:DNA-binding response regulator [Bacteroidota bacterium]